MVMANTLTLAMNAHFVSVLLVSVKHHRLELKKKQHFVAIPPFPYFLQVKRKRKTALLFNAVISRSLFCYMMANISHGNNRNNYTDS
jgi:hypothetical protein